MKKKIIITAACSMLLALVFYAGISFNENNGAELKITDNFLTYENLLEKSPIAITGTVMTDNEEFSYKEMSFAMTEVKINQSIRGADSLQTISILQTKSAEDPYLEKGKEVLLFLTKYDGPIVDKDAYVINGLYNGQFKIEGDSIKNVLSTEEYLMSSSKLDDIISDIKNTEFKPDTISKGQVNEDIEDQNQNEKQLKEQLEKESVNEGDSPNK